jgi:hypothetical protein
VALVLSHRGEAPSRYFSTRGISGAVKGIFRVQAIEERGERSKKRGSSEGRSSINLIIPASERDRKMPQRTHPVKTRLKWRD